MNRVMLNEGDLFKMVSSCVKTILRECSIDFLTSFVGGSAIGIFLPLLLAYLVAIHLIDSMVQKKIL